eukprot:TRINITY_DN9691_c0_g1_i1.p1 TRINITY_DN9691_c0_g1~~TRINITY_DN9691_c0_g1_i1.p1  ORF type:complete len:303 (+),score=57.32 TRINITY_DN9691_c0_g1_i1:542-1450(+)
MKRHCHCLTTNAMQPVRYLPAPTPPVPARVTTTGGLGDLLKMESRENVMNQVGPYAAEVLKSERARTNPGLVTGFKEAIEGSAIYLPGFLDPQDAEGAFEGIKGELEAFAGGEGMVAWSKHQKCEDPGFSESFKRVVKRMEDHFSCDAFATRLNIYRDGSDWKPFHHDSHAYHEGAGDKEDFTMGLSLGATRALEFLHVDTTSKFSFPQQSGDVFAFTSVANRLFQHGVPRSTTSDMRISIIAWGRRRQLTTLNSSLAEREANPNRAVPQYLCQCGCRAPRKIIKKPVNPAKAKTKKKSRLQ